MALSVFDDKTCSLHRQELLKVLGPAGTLWDELKHQMVLHFSPIQEEWVFSGKNYGWALRLRHNKRAILYMTPCKHHFEVGFTLGEKAVRAARQSDLPETLLTLIK